MMHKKQIERRISDLRREIEILESVLIPTNLKMGRPKGSFKYTPEQIKFIEENKDIPMKELVTKFNEKFKTNYTQYTRAIYNFMVRKGIIEINTTNKSFHQREMELAEEVNKSINGLSSHI